MAGEVRNRYAIYAPDRNLYPGLSDALATAQRNNGRQAGEVRAVLARSYGLSSVTKRVVFPPDLNNAWPQHAPRGVGGVRHQRDLAEPARALVRVEHLEQHILAPRGARLDDTSGFEPDFDAVDQRPLIGKRFGADDTPLDAMRMRRCEHFLGRDVWIAGDSILGGRRAALPFVGVGESDREIRSRAPVVKGAEPPGVQPLRAPAESQIVRAPG